MKLFLLIHSEPAHYPPLLNACKILRGIGYEITILGMSVVEEPFETGFAFEADIIAIKNGRTKYTRFMSFLRFILSGAFNLVKNRPAIVYFHDPRASVLAPIAVLLRIPFVYHEHDTPKNIQGTIRKARNYVLKHSSEVIFPNKKRMNSHDRSLVGDRVIEVWNCPIREEVRKKASEHGSMLKLYYHGSIGPERLPVEILDGLAALPEEVTFNFAGYETEGTYGYIEEYLRYAERLGLGARVEYLGKASRQELLNWAGHYDVGWAVVPTTSIDVNLKHMLGASNKVFDYMSQGLAVLVGDKECWRRTFGGYGLTCDPSRQQTIATSLAWFMENRDELTAMGERGRKKILDEWNYEKQFEKVKTFLDLRQVA